MSWHDIPVARGAVFAGLLMSVGVSIVFVGSDVTAAPGSRPASVHSPAAKAPPAVTTPRVRTAPSTRGRQPRKERRFRSRRQSLAERDRRALREPLRPRDLEPSRIRIIDGDTFSYGTERFHIERPEPTDVSPSQRLNRVERLQWWLQQGPVKVIPKGLLPDGRILATVLVDSHNVLDLLE